MSNIDICRPHGMPHAEARSAVDDLARSIADRFGIRCEWQGDVLAFSRQGVDGSIAVRPDQIHVRAKLGLLMRALKPMIEQEIVRYLDQRLG